jgi:endonuclease I
MNRFFARLLTAALAVLCVAPAARADVLISELCDPRLNYLTDRYIEIYNSGASSVDLTGWQLTAMGNGVEIFTWNLSGSIAPGEALVAGDATTVDVFPVDFPSEGWSDNVTNWNGKVGDGARLRNGSGVIIEEIIVPDTTFENDVMERNEGVTSPSLTFNLAEWTITPVDYPSEGTPGVHHPVVEQGPTIGVVSLSPVAPLPGEAFDVQAEVTDLAAVITGVTLDWGTAPGALTNSIAMAAAGGDSWVTATTIPGQAAGTTVYYAVTAANDVPAESVSAEFSYGVPLVVTVAAIQGAADASPYAGQSVTTSGVVTAAFGSTFVIQDGAGARSGLWVTGAAAPALGLQVDLNGVVAEVDGNTTLTAATVLATAPGSLPAAGVVTTGEAAGEDFEGVLVQVLDAACTVTAPQWLVSNSGGAVAVAGLAVSPDLVLGTRYDVTGPVSGAATGGGVVPRTLGDIVFSGDTAAPVVTAVQATGPTSVQLTFSEDLDPATAQDFANYTLSGGAVTAAVFAPGAADAVNLTVTAMANGSKSLTIDGVADLFSNAMSSVAVPFYYYGGDIPAGYYDPAEGLLGEALRGALHDIIDGHTSIGYTSIWTAFYTTDDKDNGKVWDMYSDVPGGVPPYEYDFGVDEGGTAGTEGTGYNREHSWPSSWYGAVSPMYTDLFMVYPTDNDVNNKRSNYPFGEVDAPTWTSLNGSRLGPCSYPGYTGTVFEPIDEYKGDFARAYFYMSTRYYGEDASWPGSPATDGSQLLPWTEALLLAWHAADPVSTKEIDRNEAVYAIQNNRNPFIDRPDFVMKVFQPELSPVPQPLLTEGVLLHQNAPNPFNPATVISFELESGGPVDLQVFDVAGRLVRTLYAGTVAAGRHELTWQGRDGEGRSVAAGVYFYRLRADGAVQTKRMLLAK